MRGVVRAHMAADVESVAVPFRLVGDNFRKEIAKTVVLA
jgi:hypothetical protein